jgi:hypothetical protein
MRRTNETPALSCEIPVDMPGVCGDGRDGTG